MTTMNAGPGQPQWFQPPAGQPQQPPAQAWPQQQPPQGPPPAQAWPQQQPPQGPPPAQAWPQQPPPQQPPAQAWPQQQPPQQQPTQAWPQQQPPQGPPAQAWPPQPPQGPPPAQAWPQQQPPQQQPPAQAWQGGPPPGAPPVQAWGGPPGMPAPAFQGPPQGPPQGAPAPAVAPPPVVALGPDGQKDYLANYTLGSGGHGGDRPFMQPGLYPRVLLQGCRSGEGGEQNDLFVAFDFKVLEPAQQTEATPPHAVGTEFVVLCFLTGKQAKVGPRLLKDILEPAIGNIPRAQIQTPVLKWAEQNIGKIGVEMTLHAYSKPKKSNKSEYVTAAKWGGIPGKRVCDAVPR